VGAGTEENDGQWISLDPPRMQETADTGEDYDIDVEEHDISALAKFRRGEDHEATREITDEATQHDVDSGPASWHTFKYRPILGIVPLDEYVEEGEDRSIVESDGVNGGPVDDSGTGFGVEVALVERPLWDLDLPPRYQGDQEWNPDK